MACNFCNETIYIKIRKYLKTIAAPITKAEALRQQLEDMTGEAYRSIDCNFCPMCGANLHISEKDAR